MAQTLYDKLWASHLVADDVAGKSLLYIDRHLVHEVTSPQAFDSLRASKRELWRRESILATADHNVPTTQQGVAAGIADETAGAQVNALTTNCKINRLRYYGMGDQRQGIVHIIGPEQGATLPGMTVVCGDSHTSTHGALGVLAMGIGTSDVAHVLATQCLLVNKLRNMRVVVTGRLGVGVSAKDMILSVIAAIGTAGGTGYAIEYSGEAVRSLSVEGRMTVCNMTIEAGAQAGMVAYDETTEEYVRGRPWSPHGQMWESSVAYWRGLVSDEDAVFDKTVSLNADAMTPQITWGTSPEMVVDIEGCVPSPEEKSDTVAANSVQQALDYMGLKAGTPMVDVEPDTVFIGSCTNSRIEDLRAAAQVLHGKKISRRIRRALVVPGSGLVKQMAEKEGLAKVFVDAGFEWRNPGCSMCLAMNDDKLKDGERCISTSNRNFEGRQGQGGRTHLASPAMAAAAAVAGHFIDVRDML